MTDQWRQKLHLEPPAGWLNDPNGLSWFGGYYHVYFQYSPDSALGKGRKCWGHFQSSDLLNWEFTGTVLFPDLPEDRSGVYSGCGFVKDDTLYLFYTGNVKEEGDHDYIRSGRGANVILVTTKDGRTMSEKRVLLRNADYPPYCSCHVRDPKVWEENGSCRMVLGARTLDDEGCVLFYRSEDLLEWTFEKKVSIPGFGYMWECPDYFTLPAGADQQTGAGSGSKGAAGSARTYLSVSPQGVPHEEYRFQNVYSAGYFAFDGEEVGEYREWDLGFDFYAPQTFEAPDGRRLLIGWMGIGDIPYTNPTTELGWQHCLTLIRELSAGDDYGIVQKPIRELLSIRGEGVPVRAGAILRATFPFDMELVPGTPTEPCAVTVRNDVRIAWENGVLELRFTDDSVGCGRTVRKARLAELSELRLIVDRSSLEVYANGGALVMSTRFYPPGAGALIKAQNLAGTAFPLIL